jgi:hypothetical protein
MVETCCLFENMIVESYLIGEIYGWDGLYLLYLLSRVKYGKISY